MMRRFIPGRFSSKSHFLLAFRKKSGVLAQKGVLNQGVLNQTDCMTVRFAIVLGSYSTWMSVSFMGIIRYIIEPPCDRTFE